MTGREGRGRALRLLQKATATEAAGWRSLFRWIARRPRVAEGERAFGYASPVLTVLIVFIALSALEIPILDLILRPWWPARLASLVLGLWGLSFMFGLLAGLLVHPHAVGPTGLRVRHGSTFDVLVPWDAIERIAAVRHGLPTSRTLQLEHRDERAILSVAIASETTIEVRLNRRPITVPLPDGQKGGEQGGEQGEQGGEQEIVELRFSADDAAALVALAREQLGLRLSE